MKIWIVACTAALNSPQNTGNLETVKIDVCDTEIFFSGEIRLEGISVTPPINL